MLSDDLRALLDQIKSVIFILAKESLQLKISQVDTLTLPFTTLYRQTSIS